MNSDHRSQLLAGHKLHFPAGIPEHERTIQAHWIEEAVGNKVVVDLSNAIIVGELKLRYASIEQEFSLVECRVKECANFSYATFKRNLVLKTSVFEKGATFESASLQCDGVLWQTEFVSGEAMFTGTKVSGMFAANELKCGKDVVARFDHAQFDKNLALIDSTFEGVFSLFGSKIQGMAMFAGAIFKRWANFSTARFLEGAFFQPGFESSRKHGAIFEGKSSFIRTQIDGQAVFAGVLFGDEADFRVVRIGDVSSFAGSVFKKDALFAKAQFSGNAFFSSEQHLSPAVFEGEADFKSAHIGGEASFRGVHFNGKANFVNADIVGDAHFNGIVKDRLYPTVFEDEVNFRGAHICGQAGFCATTFKRTAMFGSVTIDAGIFFGCKNGQGAVLPAAKFEGEAVFSGLRVELIADFRGVTFQNLTFQQAKINGTTVFVEAVFGGEADLSFTHFNGNVSFNDASFHGAADFSVSVFSGLALFTSAVFTSKVSFCETSFRVVRFSLNGCVDSARQFQGAVDLCGCTYDRIQAEWQSLTANLYTYDRQPYVQLEKVLRTIGSDEEANCVYLDQRQKERKNKWKARKWMSWLGSVLYWRLARYGVRPMRLISFSLVALIAGTLFFSQMGAVVLKDERVFKQLNIGLFPLRGTAVAKEEAEPHARSIQLGAWDAFAVSLHQFLPIEVPMGSKWIPSDTPIAMKIFKSNCSLPFTVRPTTFATFVLKLAGWILVPFGVAVLTGVLRAKP